MWSFRGLSEAANDRGGTLDPIEIKILSFGTGCFRSELEALIFFSLYEDCAVLTMTHGKCFYQICRGCCSLFRRTNRPAT
jgi:hypothetical protein